MSDFFKGVGVVTAVVLTVLAIASTKTIRQGEVGVVTRFGRATGRELDAGLNLKWPVDGVVVMDTKIKKEELSDINSGTKDLQSVLVDVVLNYHINSEDASDIFARVRDDNKLPDTIILPAVQETVKAIVSQYKAEELLTKRAEVKATLDEELVTRLAEYWVRVDEISLTDITFSKEFDNAIESKQVAEQEAQKAKYEAEKALTQKQAEVDKAKLDVQKAKAEAEQNKVQSQQLSDQILRKAWIDKWDGKLPEVVGSGELIYNLGE